MRNYQPKVSELVQQIVVKTSTLNESNFTVIVAPKDCIAAMSRFLVEAGLIPKLLVSMKHLHTETWSSKVQNCNLR